MVVGKAAKSCEMLSSLPPSSEISDGSMVVEVLREDEDLLGGRVDGIGGNSVTVSFEFASVLFGD